MQCYHIALPVKLILGITKKTNKVKEYSLNLNTYRNTHFIVLNKAKKIFTDTISSYDEFKKLPKLNKVFLIYIHHPARTCDTNNVCSVVDKFFQDTLVTSDKLTDDNFKYVTGTLFLSGSVDRKNPRVDVYICERD